jgi:hypothetical protein
MDMHHVAEPVADLYLPHAVVHLASVVLHAQLLKQRVSQLENTAQQTDVVRQENALLRQQLAEMEAAVSGQPCRVTSACPPCFAAAGTTFDLRLQGPLSSVT